jgi:GAF domain-containing protein
MNDRQEFRRSLAEAARTLHHPESLDEVLTAIATTACESMPGFDLAGISTVDGHGNVVTRAVNDQRAYELDQLQYSQGEGPCLDAMGHARKVVVPRLRHEQRWPRYVPAALKYGLRSQMGIQLSLDDVGTLGGLNLYSTTSDEVDDEAESMAELFAVHAAIALGCAREIETLNAALHTRKVIGQALGILMERYVLSEDKAFAFLVRASSTSNVKLHLVAQEIVLEANVMHGTSAAEG